jgi:hypothetical protein
MKNKLILLLVVFSFLIISPPVFASNTNGTIDPTYHYAWGENVGWVDFANITITDSGLSGSAYGENIGWIDLSTITNNSQGTLSGYAWGENVGWVDFSQVAIGTDGIFTGNAYGENIGWITFGTGDNKVETDWRPLSARPTSHTSSGGYLPGYGPKANTPPIVSPITPPNTPPTLPPVSPNTCPNGMTPISNCTIAPANNMTFTFTKNLKLGMTDPDVKQLQIFLNTHNFPVSLTGAGSTGNETSYFGQKTKLAVTLFQKANSLTPVGMLGPLTRGIINNIINK